MSINKSNLLAELDAKDKELGSDISLLGMTALTFPGLNNSMRGIMFTSHLKQFVNLIEPEFPIFFTNAENTVGMYSCGYKKAKRDLVVYKKIYKYKDMMNSPNYGVVFLYDQKRDQYTCIDRKEVENLTEIFGYQYDNRVLDALDENQFVPQDTVLCKSTSYDENMNYSYGINVPFMYSLDPQTGEDAAVVSESLAKRMTSIEVKEFAIPINDNHFLLNLYGDDKNYQPFPAIGETVKNGILCAKRTLFTNQVLNDFKNSSLKKINFSTDEITYGAGEVLDIKVYCNNTEIKQNSFNKMILKYMNSERKYYEKINETCKKIISSGAKVAKNINAIYKRSKDWLNDDYKWKEGDGIFSNLIVVITVKNVVPLQLGQKITGRYGNKSVISEIRPDFLMPHREDGQPIHLLLSVLGIINRTTSAPLFEQSITFICGRIREYASTLNTLKEKETIIFDVVRMLNEAQYKSMKATYSALNKEEKAEYIRSCIEENIYIHEQPIGSEVPLFLRINEVYKKYGDILKPYRMFVYRYGRWIETETPMYAGQMYILKLKQTSRKGFSACSTGAINMESLPEKTHEHKNGTSKMSRNPVRFGEFETYNFKVGMLSENIAKFFMHYRTSIKGRRDLAASLLTDDECSIDDSYTSRVNEIFGVILKSLGLELKFKDDTEELREYDDDIVKEFTIGDDTFMCTEWEFYKESLKRDIQNKILEESPLIDIDVLAEQVCMQMNEKLSLNFE